VVPFGKTVWNPGESLVFRATITFAADAPELAQGSSTGAFTIAAEARNDA
jgi:hypothetical protein